MNEKELDSFLEGRNLSLVSKISKGFSSEIFLVQNNAGESFALKFERSKSRRMRMAEKEVQNLKIANSAGIGPQLFDFDFDKRIILMEFIEGKRFGDWLFDSNPSKKDLFKVLDCLMSQAKKLDKLGLDHGQLAGKGRNIMVKPGLEAVILDFEKGSISRKPHNCSVLEAFFFKNPKSRLCKKIRQILEME